MSPQEIYQQAVSAGFSPQAAVTMTAIAMAESGGNPGAVSPKNKNGTIDRGLWQINSVHSQYDPGRLVSDPAYNAQAAFAIAGGGTNFKPWSTYNNGAYKKFLGQAQFATGSAGIATGATSGKTITPASSEDRPAQIVNALAGNATPQATPVSQPSQPSQPSAASGAVGAAIQAALGAVGVPYKWGGNSMSNGVDCSGLIQQAYKAAGIDLPRVSNDQINAGTPVDPADMAPGDLLGWAYNKSLGGGATHVAMYIGGGKMVEALHSGLPVHVVDVRTPQFVTRISGSNTTSTAQQQPQFHPDDSLDSRMASILAAFSSSSHLGQVA